ncbi:phage integrase family protein [Candidatus Bathyarchaeota archaeon]|nr:MAG: phage integrase family protein [Candidatus Bathyarchaeota archaeon]
MEANITFRDIDALIFLHPSIRRWLQDKPDSTVYNNYGRNLLYFTKRHNIAPEQLLPQQVIDEEGLKLQSLKPLAIVDLLQQTGKEETNAKASRIDLAIRSYCKENGRNDLGRSKLRHIKEKWYRGYTKEEARKLLGYITKPLFKLYAYINLESGLRVSHVLAIKYKHIQQDLDAGLDTIAIRFEPKYYFARGKKAGFTFIGKRSIELLRQCIKDGLISTDPETNLFQSRKHSTFKRTSITEFITLAKEKAHLDPDLQPTHGLRKYFENALDEAKIPEKAKEMIEGHYPDTRAKHYSNRDFEYLRQFYEDAYPFIDLEITDPRLPTKLQHLENELEELRMQRNILSHERNNLTGQQTSQANAFITLFGTKEGRKAIRNAIEFADQLESNPTWQRFTSQLGQDAENRGGLTPEEVKERVLTITPRVIRQIRPDLPPLPPKLHEQLKKHLLGANG